MVEKQLRRRGVRDERVLHAMSEIRREDFIPTSQRVLAYQDEPAYIGHGQTVSQPFMTALMAESLQLKETDTVLEVGAGCGYAAAVMGAIAARVITVEIIPGLAELARENLKRAGREGNITVVLGDGSIGYREMAPYDAISVAAAAPDVPPALIEQLKDPGVLVIPVGERGDQELRIIRKQHGEIDHQVVTMCSFVPLVGQEGWQ
jgi:protein-L-isoaspartate(D-aspartate) O-methyltransferase